MVSIIKVTPLYILVLGKKKIYRPIAFRSLLSKELFIEVIQFFWLFVLVAFGAVD